MPIDADVIVRPNITSKQDLKNLCEVSDASSDAFLRTTFTYVDADDRVWFGQVDGVDKFDVTVEDINRLLMSIPDDAVYPDIPPDSTILTERNEISELYIKRPRLLCLDEPAEAKLIPGMFLEEARVLEQLKPFGHPNLIRYVGCVPRRGKMVGIALEKHDVIMQYRFEDDPRPLDIAACMAGLRSGIEHLHLLGYAHNDLNPMNIAFDKGDRPVIVDFGSCSKFGATLTSGGTQGWTDEDWSTSVPEHDLNALPKIESWLVQKKSELADLDPAQAQQEEPSL